jgi:DNA-binding XRE family transcriptional regulator
MEDMEMTTKARTKGVSLDDMIAQMPAKDQREVERRAGVLIAQHVALRQVRKAMGKTQATIAKQLGIKQENVARIEQRSDMLLSTLRGYVRALGGEVRLVVEVKGHPPVELEGLGDLAPAVATARSKAASAKPAKGRRVAA